MAGERVRTQRDRDFAVPVLTHTLDTESWYSEKRRTGTNCNPVLRTHSLYRSLRRTRRRSCTGPACWGIACPEESNLVAAATAEMADTAARATRAVEREAWDTREVLEPAAGMAEATQEAVREETATDPEKAHWAVTREVVRGLGCSTSHNHTQAPSHQH